MPPRAAARGRNRGATPRGGPPPRGGTPTRGGGPGAPGAPGLPASHVNAVGVKRRGFGTRGRPVVVFANFYEISAPEEHIYHYDVAFTPSEDRLPEGLKRDLVDYLQDVVAPHIFVKKASYDGNKNLFSPEKLDLGPEDSAEFDVTPDGSNGSNSSPGENAPTTKPKRKERSYKIRLTKVNEINPEIVQRLIAGQQSPDSHVQTALTAMNVVYRMEPIKRFAYNRRSFFTDVGARPIGGGIILLRGYFQSIRPALGKIYVNIDISTGMMAKPGSLIDLCLEFLNEGRQQQPIQITQISAGMPDRERRRLEKFLFGINVTFTHGGQRDRRRAIRGLSTQGASQIRFTLRDGQQLNVASYFRSHHNHILQFPDILCIKIGQDSMVPLEVCNVPFGQLLKKEMPPDKIDRIREFSTLKPADRLRDINHGLSLLAHGQSEYVRAFGMGVNSAAGPARVNARVLDPPPMTYAPTSKVPTVQPRNGAWNMADKKFIQPAKIDSWFVAIYEQQRRFSDTNAKAMVRDLVTGCRNVGITVQDENPVMQWLNGQGNIGDQLKALGRESFSRKGKPPQLVVVILPDNGNDIYVQVKNFGDVQQGVATQCMKSSKCFRANAQYYANVCLKINVKLGGINTIPDKQASSNFLADPRNPTIVMGADVMHPAPGSDRPSFTAMVGSLDPDAARYTARSCVQSSRVETIEEKDYKEMAKAILTMHRGFNEAELKKPKPFSPTRLYFYRDGVSEGQFQQILDAELPALKAACAELGMKPKITMIIVAKRHHTRLFPTGTGPHEVDRSGNCAAGTIIDTTIVHPVEWDWYLQSHAGILGTSRSAHYNVIYDENDSTADGLQALSFALCHVYARSTRSVSIPAPVYYADIVCSRAKHHFAPNSMFNISDTASGATDTLQRYKAEYQPAHRNMQRVMYFS